MESTQDADFGGEWASAREWPGPSRRVADAWLTGLGFNRAAPAQVLIRLLDASQTGCLFREDLPPGVIDAALVHSSRKVRETFLDTPIELTAQQWDQLIAADPEPKQRAFLAEEAGFRQNRRPWWAFDMPDGAAPPATSAEIDAMAEDVPDIDPGIHIHALWWVGALHENPKAMRQLAASEKLWVRRSVARARHLPADVVTRLAGDEDRIVRLFLAESCDDAPPDMLLEVWTWWSGSFSFPGRPRNHPNC